MLAQMPESSSALRNFLAGPAWSLPGYLLLALGLRLPAVFFARGFEYLDQQYQSIDPAWHLATGLDWYQTWEWVDGIRSWVYPHFLATLFRAGMACGLESAQDLLTFARAVQAVLSLLPMAIFWLLVVRWRPLAQPRLALLLVAGSGFVVGNGVQPSASAMSATLALTAALACAQKGAWPLLGGVALGLAFTCRFQEALFGPALVVVLAWQRRWSCVRLFVLGCVPGIALQAGVDYAYHGSLLHSPFAYVDKNLTQGAASRWQQEPWWFYWLLGVVPVAMLVPMLLGSAWRRLCIGAQWLPATLAAALWHIGLHSFIARKAMRFEYPALMMLGVVVAIGLTADRSATRTARWHTVQVVTANVMLWLMASFWFHHAGPLRAAVDLGNNPAFTGTLWVVGGEVTSTGGHCHLDRREIAVTVVPRAGLLERFRSDPPRPGTHVMVVRNPLDASELQSAPNLRFVEDYHGMFDLRASDRRFVYRWLP